MDIKIARNLVKDTFENGFDKNRFYYFIKNLLNEIEEQDKDKFIYKGKFIREAFRPYIKTLERIGKYQDSKRNKIDILIVQLKKETSLEYARTMQRNFIAWYLNGSRGDVLKDAALVAFVSPNQDDWRFSLVRMDYKIVDSGKVKQELTPAKRFSFLVGENEASHTAQSKLSPLIEDDKNNPTLDQLEEVFNIEKVTKEFFEKYRELFLWVKDELEKLVKNDKKIEKDFEQKGVNTVDFAKKLLGQIVFLYFLQKKGWFGVQRDEDWGTGPKDFLRRLFEKQIADYKNFFNEILEPLFYKALARERDDNFYSRFDCKIPFLNGGLFDPLNDYDWVHTDINLPNELFSNSLKAKEGDTGTGILDIFDRFNFTVKEDEPLDKEVAVDPEMLGKVFENLLEVKDRKSKGTYYTPREIVHYMCQQSLINYLATELDGKVNKKDIEKLIQLGETALENDSLVTNKGYETKDHYFKLPESIRKNAKLIDAKLAGIKVCDPAIGSGAFPVGMMNIIIKTRNVLSSYIKGIKDRSTYDFKRHAIASSLYGVDIDLGAVEIAKLRLWLSLIVDEQDIKKIKPLPNLDYKIMQGNSLIELLSPDLVRKGSDQEKNKLIDQLSELKNQYFEATSRKIKLKLRDQINELIVFIANYDKAKELEQSKNLLANLKAQKSLFSLGPENLTLGEVESKEVKKLKKKVQELEKIKDTSPEDHFEWHLNFNEVFEENGGFDVIIANPPYLKERDNKIVFRAVMKTDWGKKWHQGKMDFWYFFLHKAIDIVKIKGVISFITSRYWLNSSGAKKLIQRVKDNLSFVAFVDIGKLKVFDEVAGQHMVAVYMKSKMKDKFIYKKLVGDLSHIDKQENTVHLDIKKIYNSDIYSEDDEILIEDDFIDVRNTINLGNICEVSQGVVEAPDKVSKKALKNNNVKNANVGDGVFVLTEKEISLLQLNNEEQDVVKKYLDPGDVYKYGINPSDKYLIYSDKKIKEKIKNDPKFIHLNNHLNKFSKIITSSNAPYGLHRPRQIKFFTNPKIIFKNMFVKPDFVFDRENYFFGFSFSSIIQRNIMFDLKYVLAILNSSLAFFWFQNKCKKRGAGFDVGVRKIRKFPVKRASIKEQGRLVSLVDKVLSLAGSDDYLESNTKKRKVKDYEKQIDQMIYKLYSLTPEEIKVIEENTK